MKEKNVVICPPCGENVALATKRGANKVSPILPLLPRLTAVLPQSGKTCLTTLLPGYAVLPPQGGKIERHNSNLASQGREITTRGFTLIELLVVVLIIGILAAVAVPQYQKAVEKSKAAQAWTMLKAAYQATVSYHLANGSYPTTISELDIDIPWTGTTKWYSLAADEATRSNEEWSLTIDYTKVAIGRINGPYAGGGFAIYFENGKLICVERAKYGSILEEEGKYCQKLFGGDLNTKASSSSLRQYSMP